MGDERAKSYRYNRLRSISLVLGLVAGMCVVIVEAFADSGAPSAMATEQHFAVSVGGSCAVTDQGEMRCWGPTWDGGLANGTGGTTGYAGTAALIPVPSNLTTGVAKTTGTCALVGTGVQCWGSAGIIEDGTGSLFSDPPWGSTIPRSYGFAAATDIAGRCALLTAGTVQCYGWDTWGNLGNGGLGWPAAGYPRPPPSSSTAVNVSGLTDVVDIDGTCALKDNGVDDPSVWCWGVNNRGQLGNGDSGGTTYPCNGQPDACTDSKYSATPVQVQGIDDALQIRGTCALREEGKVSCWGANDGGRFDPTQPGDPSGAPIYAPIEIGAFEGAVDVFVSSRMACAALANGSVRCQGAGSLGDGTYDYSTQRSALAHGLGTEPENHVIGLSPIGYYGVCARTASGTVACWGDSARYLGIGSGTYDRTLVPTYVVGFGGEVPEDDLNVTVEILPDEVLLALDAGGTPVPDDSVVATVTIANDSAFDVPDVVLDGTLATTLEFGDTKAIAQVGQPAPAPAPASGEVELGEIAAGTSRQVSYVFEVSDAGIFGVEALVRWADPLSSATETGFAEDTVEVDVDDGFEIELTGRASASPTGIELIATARNLGESAITNIDWGAGISSEVLAPADADPGDGVSPDPLGEPSRPTPDLPTTLGAGDQAVIRWTLGVQSAGVETFTLTASGTNDAGGVSAFEQLSASVNERLLESIDITRAAADGLVDWFRQTKDLLVEKWNESIAETAHKTGFANETEAFRQREIDSWRQLGFSDTTSRFLASGRVQRQAIANYFEGYIAGGEATIDRLGAEGGESLWKIWDTATDPLKRDAFATAMVERARDEVGYLADGYANPNTPLITESAYGDLMNAGSETLDSIGFALVGQADLWSIEGSQFAENPLEFSRQVGSRHGGQHATVAWYTASGVVEEVATGGLGPVTRAGRVVEGGVDGLRTTRKAADTVDAGTDALGQAQRRFAEAEDVVLRYQDLPYGTTLDFEQLDRLAGFSAADGARISAIVDEAKTKFGIDVEVVFRTAEPFSAGIDGVGKRAFTKEKAVGAMDLMLGAPPDLKGKVAIFEPQPLPKVVVDAMDFDNPGFASQYYDRLKTQQKNWDAFNDGSARTLNILDGSSRYGGVHAFDGVPGQKLYGVDYLEQLDDATYLASRPDLTPAQINELRNTPATFTKMELDVVDGAFTLSDNVRLPDGTFQKKPVISDYDGQAVIPANNADWPSGKRSQIETFVHSELKKIDRYGRHGWSDTANDLPADLFFLPAEYIMSTTHPAAAGRVARDLSRRFNVLADEFRNKANRLEALPATPSRTSEIAALRSRASMFDQFTPEEIIKRWPAGEKTVVFTQGRISVGSNQGT